MIALLAAARSRIADALDARTLARTVLVLSRQLDHAHLAGQIEEARADRLEERVAELEAETRDWSELSGELVAEQAADLPDLEPADDSGPPSPLPADPYARAEVQARRADAAERHRLAAEAHAADLESELATVRAQLRQTERAAGAHVATISALREQIAAAHRAAHAPAPIDPPCQCGHEAKDHGRGGCLVDMVSGLCPCERFQVYGHHPRPAEQIPGVAAADALTESERREGYLFGKQTGIGFAAGCQAIAETKAARATAGTDDPPPTRPSERTTRTT